MGVSKTNKGLNPSPTTTPLRKKQPLQEAYSLDANNAVSEIQKIIRQKYTTDITSNKNDYVCKAITKPVVRGEGALSTLSLRARARNLHDYLPILDGPPSEDSVFGRLQICKAFLHPEFSSTQPNLFASLEPGSEFLGDLQFPKSPLEFYNGTIKSNYTRGVDIAGLTPSSAFKVCRDFIHASSVSAATGKANGGSRNPGSLARAAGAVTEAQLRQQCNTKYKIGDFIEASDLATFVATSAFLKEMMDFIASHEGYIPQVREDWDFRISTGEKLDSVGYGSVVEDRAVAGGAARRAALTKILRDTRPKDSWGTVGSLDANGNLKPVPKSVWSKFGKRNYSKIIEGDYTLVTELDAKELALNHDIIPTVRKFNASIKKGIEVTESMMIAVASASYQVGSKGWRRVARALNQKLSVEEIYSVILDLTPGQFRKRRLMEAEYFFGNKTYKYTDKDRLRK
tara:strand:+ start:9294 stop:10661 length:1368 start_codon:yes stop_codon:yes gene_type:complete